MQSHLQLQSQRQSLQLLHEQLSPQHEQINKGIVIKKIICNIQVNTLKLSSTLVFIFCLQYGQVTFFGYTELNFFTVNFGET